MRLDINQVLLTQVHELDYCCMSRKRRKKELVTMLFNDSEDSIAMKKEVEDDAMNSNEKL